MAELNKIERKTPLTRGRFGHQMDLTPLCGTRFLDDTEPQQRVNLTADSSLPNGQTTINVDVEKILAHEDALHRTLSCFWSHGEPSN